MSVAAHETAVEALSHPASRFDRDTGNKTILPFRALDKLRNYAREDLKQHLDDFSPARDMHSAK